MSEQIYVYDKDTGAKRLIPARWLELDHPQFKKFRKTPLQKKSDSGKGSAPEPSTTTESEG